jgi:hypothetical protein
MFIAQMSVGSHRQCSTVLMSEPAAYRRDVDPALDAFGGEVVPEIVMGESVRSNLLTGSSKALLTGFHGHNETIPRPRSHKSWFCLDSLKEVSHRRQDGNKSGGTVLSGRDPNSALVKIYVTRSNANSLTDPAAAIRQKLNKIAVASSRPCPTPSNTFHDLVKLLTGR